MLGQSLWKPFPVYEARRAPDPSYIYGGIIIPHYGHFICSSLSRLWYLLEKSAEKSKVLFHAPSRVGTNPPGFILEFLSAAGLPPDRVVVFERPTWVQRLVIPAPAMIEQSHAHSVARRTFENIGDRLASKRTPKPTAVPIYLSKAALDTGLTRIENEVVLEIELNRLGVEIVYPEKLSIRAQVDLFRSNRSIIGFTSSAFHTSAFAEPSGKRIIISFDGLNSNQLLIDRLTHPNSTYITPPPKALIRLGVAKSSRATID